MLELDAARTLSITGSGDLWAARGALRDLASGVASIESALELEDFGRSKLVELRLP